MTDTGIPGEDRSVVPGAVPNAEPEQVADTNAPAGPNKDDSDPVSDAISDDARSSARGKLGWLSITVAVIFGLFILQSVLVDMRDSSPAIAALHPVNGFLIVLLAVVLARDSWMMRTAAA